LAIQLFEGLPDRDDESPARGAGCVSSRSAGPWLLIIRDMLSWHPPERACLIGSGFTCLFG
jgi:hypothetical protein